MQDEEINDIIRVRQLKRHYKTQGKFVVMLGTGPVTCKQVDPLTEDTN